ncbi:phage tail protein, partial [Bacillus sp. TH008]
IDGILQNLPQLIEAAIELIFAIAQALIEHLPEILDAGMQILMAVVDGIMQMLPELFSVGMEIVGEIAGAIIDNSGQIFDVGADIVNGLWEGIDSMKGWLNTQIGGFVDSVTDSFKSFFGIHSPSRLFRNEIGKFLPMGLALGIERNIGVVKAAANEMANAALINPQSYAVNPSLALGGGTLGTVKYAVESGSGVDPKQQQPIVIESVFVVDSEELGRMTESAVSAEQGKKITITNYMRGD